MAANDGSPQRSLLKKKSSNNIVSKGFLHASNISLRNRSTSSPGLYNANAYDLPMPPARESSPNYISHSPVLSNLAKRRLFGTNSRNAPLATFGNASISSASLTPPLSKRANIMRTSTTLTVGNNFAQRMTARSNSDLETRTRNGNRSSFMIPRSTNITSKAMGGASIRPPGNRVYPQMELMATVHNLDSARSTVARQAHTNSEQRHTAMTTSIRILHGNSGNGPYLRGGHHL